MQEKQNGRDQTGRFSSKALNSQPAWQASLGKYVRFFLLLWEKPGWSGLISTILYALISIREGGIFGVSAWPYYNYLADAFLHGQLWLRLVPAAEHDLVFFGGHYSLYWPPFPSILLMPFVALFGVNFSDIFFTTVLGGLIVAGVAYFFRLLNQRQVIELSPASRGLLVLFFAFGTVFSTLAPRGRVWFTGQLVGFLCVLLAYISVVRWHGWKAFMLAGLAMSGALLTRNSLILAGIWPAWYLLKTHWPQKGQIGELVRNSLIGAAPVIIAVLLLGVYNWARFGSPTDIGYNYHEMVSLFRSDFQRYGPFNLHYVPINFYYQYIFYPLPIRSESYMGGSLFLLSPLFLAIFWAFGGPTTSRQSAIFLLLSILLVNIPIITLMGTGWVQFGPRYTLDFTLPLLMLTAMGLRRWPGWITAVLLLLSIAQYLVGAFISLSL